MRFDLIQRFRAIFQRKHGEQELHDELTFHIERQAEKHIKAGLSVEAAERRARLEFGGVEGIKEECRDQRFFEWHADLLRDFRYAVRSLRRTPGFTVAAIITLALGIGANTAIFSVVQGVILAPFPYSDPDRLVFVRENSIKLKREMSVSFPDFFDWQKRTRSFQQMGAIRSRSFDLTNAGSPAHLEGSEISAGFFSTLGVRLLLGREFLPQEEKDPSAQFAVISSRLWRTRFGGTPDALGQAITLDGLDYTIVGVLPDGFRSPLGGADIYTPPHQGDPNFVTDRTIHPGLACIARLKPGVTAAQAGSEMAAIQNQLIQMYPEANRGIETDVVSFRREILGDISGMLSLLLGAVALVLLIACANVANLLLTRSLARSREFAIRAALGASRIRMVRQLLTESVLVSLSGGLIGLAIATYGVAPAVAVLAGGLPRSENIRVNLTVLLFTLGVSLMVGILFGLAPAIKHLRRDLQVPLKHGDRGSTGGHSQMQGALAVVQIALTLVLLTGATLLVRTFGNLSKVDPGFDTQHLIAFKAGLSPTIVQSPSKLRLAYHELVEGVRRIPGVQAADLTVLVPFSQRCNAGPFWVGSEPPNVSAEAPRANYYWTGPDYLQTMRIPLVRGRFLSAEDTLQSPPVVIIDSDLAQTYFPNSDPVGQTLTVPHWGEAQIVGVVEHVRHWRLDNPNVCAANEIYGSFYQIPDNWMATFYPNVNVMVRTPLDVESVVPAITNMTYGAGHAEPLYNVRTMEDLVSESMGPQRIPMILLGGFAILALLLSCIGIYGVLSYSMTRRVQEVGIRLALGGSKRDILRMVLKNGLRLAFAGVTIGLVAVLVLARMLPSFSILLYEVGATDPLTIVAVSLLLTATALSACYMPARRAARLDPMIALRHE